MTDFGNDTEPKVFELPNKRTLIPFSRSHAEIQQEGRFFGSHAAVQQGPRGPHAQVQQEPRGAHAPLRQVRRKERETCTRMSPPYVQDVTILRAIGRSVLVCLGDFSERTQYRRLAANWRRRKLGASSHLPLSCILRFYPLSN